jgi:acyl-coenzyme A thioesterase PaaI-like protein
MLPRSSTLRLAKPPRWLLPSRISYQSIRKNQKWYFNQDPTATPSSAVSQHGTTSTSPTTPTSSQIPPQAITTPSPVPNSPPPPPPPRKSIFRVSNILLSLFFTTAGLGLYGILTGLNPPKQGSDLDLIFSEMTEREFKSLEIVQRLRADPAWEEHIAYSNLLGEAKATHMTAGSLRGAPGLGRQLVFRNKLENRVVTIVQFGWSTAGWPTTVHGGLIATIIQENLLRVAGLWLNTQNPVVQNFNIDYVKPTKTGKTYIIEAMTMPLSSIIGGARNPLTGDKILETENKDEGLIYGEVRTVDGIVTAKGSGQCGSSKVLRYPYIDENF